MDSLGFTAQVETKNNQQLDQKKNNRRRAIETAFWMTGKSINELLKNNFDFTGPLQENMEISYNLK